METRKCLYSAYENRALLGYEYTVKYNLGYDVPFETWTDVTGKYCKWDVISKETKDKNGGVDVTPLRELIHEMVDEEKIRQSKIAFYLLTFSLSDMKELELESKIFRKDCWKIFFWRALIYLGLKTKNCMGRSIWTGA